MSILGAHMSIAGGFHKAVEAASKAGCDCVQLFTSAPQRWPVQARKTNGRFGRLLTKNNHQWRARPISDEEVDKFQSALGELGIVHPLSHSAYLINLASPDRALRNRSIDALTMELRRAERLGIPQVVLHPGSYISGTEAAGLKRVVLALNAVHRQTRGIAAECLLETTAGQGTSLGCRFEHLAAILDGVKEPDRLGVCFDTCHVFAAGYPLATMREYRATMRQFNQLIGLARIKAFHLNDSKRPLGSRVDRHEHIGRGLLGLESFRRLLRDRRFRKTPMYLETPKGREDGENLDAVNLRTLRGLIP